LENLLNAVRIRRDNNNSVLHTPTQDLMIYSNTYQYDQSMYRYVIRIYKY
jgi:hypothetical protein